MANVSYKLKDLDKRTIKIGYVGENDHMHVLIDCKEVFDEYPAAMPTMAIVPPEGEDYPKAVTRNGNIVEWLVKNSDVAAEGDGEFQLTFTEDNVVKKSVTGRFRVERSISGSGTAPSGIDDWLTDANEALTAVEAATQDAENAAEHQPKINTSGYWEIWDAETGAYVATTVKAQGDKGDPGDPGSPGDPTELIDDTAGEGDTGKTWSADKLDDQFGGVLNDIHQIDSVVDKKKGLFNYSTGANNMGRNISPIVTFMDDDNNNAFKTFWLPIIAEKHIPVSMAVIVGAVGNEYSGSWDDIKNYHDNYGVEILSHSYYHKINASDYDDLTVDEIVSGDFGLAKAILEQHGYPQDFLVYPGSATDNNKVREAVTRCYVGGVDAHDKLNIPPISHYNIKRYHYAYDDGVTPNINDLKALVDQCVSKNGWLIFESHSQYSSMTAETAEVIRDLIDYIRSVGAEIVNTAEGFSRFANIVDIETGKDRVGDLFISPDGKTKNRTGIGFGFTNTQLHNYYSEIDSFSDENVTEERIVTNTSLFPHNDSGIMRTERIYDNIIQTFYPFHYNEIWVRTVANTDIPAEFTCIGALSGSFDQRNGLAYSKQGNCYFDTTNNRPIYCKTAGKKTVTKLTVTGGASTSGNIKIGTPLGDKTIAVTAGQTAKEIADTIASTSIAGYNVMQSMENPCVLYLTRSIAQSASHCTFADTGSTGTTISVTNATNGISPVWVDASGNVVS